MSLSCLYLEELWRYHGLLYWDVGLFVLWYSYRLLLIGFVCLINSRDSIAGFVCLPLPRAVMSTSYFNHIHFIWYFKMHLTTTFDIIFHLLGTVYSKLYLLTCQVCALKKQEGANELAWVNPTEVR